MDKWFTCPKMIDRLHDLGIHTIGMMKNGKTKYLYQGRFYKLSELYQKSTEEVTAEAILSSIIVQPCAGHASCEDRFCEKPSVNKVPG